MADRHHIENRFLAVSRRHIGRLMRNLEWRWRITCRYRPRDQNGNFCKFKMADGYHLENSFMSIFLPRIIRFLSNLVRRCKFPFRGWIFDKNWNFSNSRWRTAVILVIVLSLYLSRKLSDYNKICYADANFHPEDGHGTKYRNFSNSRWLTGAILKSFLLYLGAILAD